MAVDRAVVARVDRVPMMAAARRVVVRQRPAMVVARVVVARAVVARVDRVPMMAAARPVAAHL
jgi:hypothetical protein